MSYKDTLNLPKTTFSMKANLANLEPKLIASWQDMDIYHVLRKAGKGKEAFILHDGPPYANGLIHIGHALNKILKDIVVKYKVLSGYDCPYVVGWDCHGLPVEHQLFKELKLTKHDVEVQDFRRKAKDYALKFVDQQRDDFKRLGLFSDWDNPYLTINSKYEEAVISLLGDLASKGYIYRGQKPVNWCGRCETALAEAEVEYLDKESDSIYIKFRSKNKKVKDFGGTGEESVSFLVWTTTPWTLVSNVAVAVHPDLEYCLAAKDGEYFIFAASLQDFLKEEIGVSTEVIAKLKGSDLEGMITQHPFLKRDSKVVLADFVSNEEGSGCVHIAPGHGEEDFSLTKKYSLDIIMPIDDKGRFVQPDEFKGMDISQANALVLDKLASCNTLVKHKKIMHSYPHCWRCKQSIVFRATFQWFLKVDHKGLRENLINEIENVHWVPASGKERMRSMLVGRPDWCLSRQRLWGIPIPAIKCCSCQEVILDSEVVKNTARIFGQKGSDSWFSLDLSEFVPKDFKCSKCKGSKFEKEFDILDVWFESGASFLAVVKNNPELRFPADLYLEGSDQHRGWFQVSLIPSVAMEKVAPFKTILTHGFVVDGEGKKMSKSLGNVIAPQKISKQYGSEILRFWSAYSDYGEDVKISNEIIKQLVDMYRKVRNTIKFILGNISDFDISKNDLTVNDLLELDRFMLNKAMLLRREVISLYDEFSFYKVCQKIFNFCNLDLSSFYLDILKDRLYTFSQNSVSRRSAQFVLYHILEMLLKLIAPILSFTAEEAYLCWDNLKDKEKSIFLTSFSNSILDAEPDSELISRWGKILALRTKVLKEIEIKRTEGFIGSSLEATVILKFSGSEAKFYRKYQEALKEVFIVSSVAIEEAEPAIVIEKAEGNKCMRCWNWSRTVGKDKDYSDACSKCVATLKEGN